MKAFDGERESPADSGEHARVAHDLEIIEPDELGVLTTTRAVVAAARHVQIDREALARLAVQLAAIDPPPGPGWTDDLHFRDGTWKTAGWVLALDALNFCFWSESANPARRWRVEYRQHLYDGYWALAAALRRAVDEGKPIWDPFFLAGLTPRDVAHLLRPHDLAFPEIPLFPMRVQNLHELGQQLIHGFPDRNPVVELIAICEGSAVRLVQEIVSRFRSFNDIATYDGRPVRFYKRAQILAADLHGAFAGESLGRFHDLAGLTAFADYKVPQVLRQFGVLVYEPGLAAKIDARRLLPMGSAEEVEIRAATVWACELLRRHLVDAGAPRPSWAIDQALWTAGQALSAGTAPYHRTYTIFY